MTSSDPSGYMGKILRVDLTKEKISEEALDELTLRRYIGGTGIGIWYLYREVPPEVQWHHPENRIILASGPVGGTRIGGSGSISVVTKGCLTDGATSVQANGFFGAFLKFSGFDGIVLQGAAKRMAYLYIHDGNAELRDADHLTGKDTWQTEELIEKELGKSERELSVLSIGPAGENLVKFACIVGDRGHVAAHNGVGAVMASKKLKAIAVNRGRSPVKVADKQHLSSIASDLLEKVTSTPGTLSYGFYRWGTMGNTSACERRLAIARLPVKNYTTNLFPKYREFGREHVDPLFEIKPRPCWACRFNHCRVFKVKEGPYAGFVGEEPEYEQWAAWGPIIGQKDQMQAFILSNEVDRLGMDTNEAGWIIAWLMECYEKELLNKEDTDGIEMRWGNAEAAMAMLRKIAAREGVGNVLAEGVLRATKQFSTEARQLAIYTEKGNTPRAHDHRAAWHMLLDTCVSDTGTDEGSSLSLRPVDIGLPADTDPHSPEVAARIVAETINRMPLDDCLGMCRFNNRGPGVDMEYLAGMLQAVTGCNFTGQEVSDVGYRVVNLLRAFNIRHGHTASLDTPSIRYSSAPIDGQFQGVTVRPVWQETVKNYYRLMSWDTETGKPLPDVLKRLDLEYVIKDIW